MPDGPDLVARIWVAQVGRVPLLLLDSDIEENPRALREVTDRLYGGTSEHRLRQELLLGVGGVRALRVYSRLTGAPAPEVFHTNEGHAGFLGLERIRELTVAADGPGLDFDTALEVSRAGTVFTTHTPVPGGHRPLPPRAGRAVLRRQQPRARGARRADPRARRRGLRRRRPRVFNMAVMGFRLAQRANGVSAAARPRVSRGMFNGLWPAFDEAEVPIGSITNGVHAPTWVAREIFELAAEHGADMDDATPTRCGALVDKIPGKEIWALKRVLRERLVADARARLRKSCAKRGVAKAELGWIDSALDPDVLTIGFARRVPSYKRLTLMLRDPERLKRLLLHPERPVQLVIAGKSHPADDGGKKLIQEMVPLRRRPRGPAPDRVPAQLRHRDGAAALPRLRRLAEQPAAALRGVRHLRHEGGAQRRAQPVHPRRLVGRVVRRRRTAGRSRPPTASTTPTGATTSRPTRSTT